MSRERHGPAESDGDGAPISLFSPSASHPPPGGVEARLAPCALGCGLETKKGEDGLRAQRLVIGGERVTACVVSDGHGGAEAARLCIDMLLSLFVEFTVGDASGPGLIAAAEKAFRLLHAKLTHASAATSAGTTVTLCLINETRAELTCCSVGDSFAVLVAAPDAEDGGAREAAPPSRSKDSSKSFLPKVTELTVNPRLDDNEAERERVRRHGGQIGRAMAPDGMPFGPLRAWPGGVSCASGLGDSDCGSYINPNPYSRTVPFPATGGALIMASDGVWDAVSFERAAKVALATSNPTKAAEAIVARAMTVRGLHDDITCLVAVGASPPWCYGPSSSATPRKFYAGALSDDDSEAAVASSPPEGRDERRPRKSSGILRSLLRVPGRIISTGHSTDASVKGGKLFAAYADSLGGSGSPATGRSGRSEAATPRRMCCGASSSSMSGDTSGSATTGGSCSGVSVGTDSDHGGDQLWTYRSHKSPQQSPNNSVHVGSGIDQLQLDSTGSSLDGSIPLFAFLQGERPLVVSPTASPNSSSGNLAAMLAEELNISASLQDMEQISLPKTLLNVPM